MEVDLQGSWLTENAASIGTQRWDQKGQQARGLWPVG